MRIIHVNSDGRNHALLNNLLKKMHVIAQFYHPQCGHCQHLHPVWRKMQNRLNNRYSGNVVLARVHADAKDKLSCDTGIQGFPTIRHYKNGQHVNDFNEERTSDNLVNWVKTNSNLKLKTLTKKRNSKRGKKRAKGKKNKTKKN